MSFAQIPSHSYASAYRDSIASSSNPKADVTDVYAFRSWDNPKNAVFILNTNGGQNPSDGPLFSGFDDDVVYRIHVDNDMDGSANDFVYEIQFESETNLDQGLAGSILPLTGTFDESGRYRSISSLTGEGSEGIHLKQTFRVIEKSDGRSKVLFSGQSLPVVPANVGKRTMPDYEDLAAQGIHIDSEEGIKAFAGQRSESTYGDVGAFLDSLNFARNPAFLTEAENYDDHRNAFGENRFEFTNVNSIVIEIPIDRLTKDRVGPDSTQAPFLGVYGSAHEKVDSTAHTKHGKYCKNKSTYKQISRMGNPTLNLLINDINVKDHYNRSKPEYDSQFQEYVKNPIFANYLQSSFGLPVPPSPRLDILQILYRYPGQHIDPQSGRCEEPCADLLHLNVAVPPTMPELQSRLGALLSPDPAGLPNGRRPNDDVFDITMRAFGGPLYLAAGDGINFANNLPGSGTEDGPGYGDYSGNKLDVTTNGVVKEFPYLATPHPANGYR